MFNDKFLRGSMCVLLAINFFIIGCGGHHANCISRYTPGDENRSCSALYSEIESLDNDIREKRSQKSSKDLFNVLYIVGGVLVIIPFFFMDLKGSHEAEIEAFQARQTNLKMIFADNGCDVSNLSSPSARNMHKAIAAEKAKKMISITNCTLCEKLLQKEDGIHIVGQNRLCNQCYEAIEAVR